MKESQHKFTDYFGNEFEIIFVLRHDGWPEIIEVKINDYVTDDFDESEVLEEINKIL